MNYYRKFHDLQITNNVSNHFLEFIKMFFLCYRHMYKTVEFKQPKFDSNEVAHAKLIWLLQYAWVRIRYVVDIVCRERSKFDSISKPSGPRHE